MRVFGPRHSPYSYYIFRAPDIKALGTIFNVFGYDAVSARDLNLLPSVPEYIEFITYKVSELGLIIIEISKT